MSNKKKTIVLKRVRLSPQARRQKIIEAVIMLIEEIGFHRLTLMGIARVANTSRPLILHHFKTYSNLLNEVIQQAIDHKNLTVLSGALTSLEPYALEHVPHDLKLKAFKHLKALIIN